MVYKCNVCGKTIEASSTEDFLHVQKIVPYGSEHDGDLLNLNICSECIDVVVNMCKFNPIVEIN